MSNTITPETHAERLTYYNQGLSDAKIAKKCGVNPATIAQWRSKNGLESNHSKKMRRRDKVGKEIASKVRLPAGEQAEPPAQNPKRKPWHEECEIYRTGPEFVRWFYGTVSRNSAYPPKAQKCPCELCEAREAREAQERAENAARAAERGGSMGFVVGRTRERF